ncbi:MAG: SCO family protein [Solirubrobacterales bacterium]|nr:SCO family protein [Solirubrobacterales bacterium]
MEAGAGTVVARRSRLARVTLVMVGAGVLGACIGAAAHFALGASPSASIVSERYGLEGQAAWAAGTRAAPAIDTLVDQTGHPFALASLRGHPIALAFFDSHCNQECPLEGHELAAAESSLPSAQRPILVAVSVNPLDTPASAAKAARAWGLAAVAPWHWLMGSRAKLAPIWRKYDIYVGRPVNGDIPHTEALILIDRSGYERSAYLYPFGQQFVSHDLGVLGQEGRS